MIEIINSKHACSRFSAMGIAYANSLYPDQAQQNVGLDLRSKLFHNLILILQKCGRKNHVLQLILRLQFIAYKLPNMQRVNTN